MISGITATAARLHLCATASDPLAPKPEFDYAAFAWLFGVVVVLVSLTLVLMKYARKSAIEDPSGGGEPTFDLVRLCELRNSGELTIPEYERLSRLALEQAPMLELLPQLRQLRDTGELPVPEYEKFKKVVIRRVKEEDVADQASRRPNSCA